MAGDEETRNRALKAAGMAANVQAQIPRHDLANYDLAIRLFKHSQAPGADRGVRALLPHLGDERHPSVATCELTAILLERFDIVDLWFGQPSPDENGGSE